jgi:hypothetical protein
MLLYHCNFGWPLVDEGTDIIWKGEWQPRDETSRRTFNGHNNFRICPPPQEAHSANGEDAVYVNIAADATGMCACGLHNAAIGIAIALRFPKAQLPWFTNWQHWGKGEYVTGLEPGTNAPIGQAKARQQNELVFIQPGESRHYDLTMEVLRDQADIHNFITSNESD